MKTADPITDREKAAVLALKIGIIPDQKTAFVAASDKPAKDVNPKTVDTLAARWMRSPKIAQFATYVERLLADRDADARQRGREEAETGKGPAGSELARRQPSKAVDFYDPANQKRQINRIIQEASDDPKTQLDAIKAIQQTQRDDRQAARDQKQVKAYLPLRCDACPLMMKARKK